MSHVIMLACCGNAWLDSHSKICAGRSSDHGLLFKLGCYSGDIRTVEPAAPKQRLGGPCSTRAFCWLESCFFLLVVEIVVLLTVLSMCAINFVTTESIADKDC